MGTCPGSMCHSAGLAQRNLPATRKKTNKGLRKIIAKEGRSVLEFLFLKFRLKSE